LDKEQLIDGSLLFNCMTFNRNEQNLISEAGLKQ